MGSWDIDSEYDWYVNQIREENLERLRTFRIDWNKTTGQVIADFCTARHQVRYIINDWETANLLHRQLPPAWQSWATEEMERLKGREYPSYNPTIHFPTFASSMFDEWVAIGPRQVDDDEIELYQRMLQHKREQQQKKMETTPIPQYEPHPFLRKTHDHEAGPSRIRSPKQTSSEEGKIRSRKPRCRVSTNYERFRFEVPRDEDINVGNDEDEGDWSNIVEETSAPLGSQECPFEIESDSDNEAKLVGYGWNRIKKFVQNKRSK